MSTLRAALAERVVVADGAMGTMLQGSDATAEDFGGFEGCNEILNVTRPDIVTGVHDAYLEAGQPTRARRFYAESFAAFDLPKFINYRAQKGLGGL